MEIKKAFYAAKKYGIKRHRLVKEKLPFVSNLCRL